MNPSAGSVVPAGAVGITKHSTVVERLRQRIEGCRRHHVNCENRYQQAHAEQLEIERRETVSLYQRSLEQRAKKSAGGSSKQPQSKQPDPDSATSTEQRNNTLIAVRSSSQSRLRLPRDTPSRTHRTLQHTFPLSFLLHLSVPQTLGPPSSCTIALLLLVHPILNLLTTRSLSAGISLGNTHFHFFKPRVPTIAFAEKKPSL